MAELQSAVGREEIEINGIVGLTEDEHKSFKKWPCCFCRECSRKNNKYLQSCWSVRRELTDSKGGQSLRQNHASERLSRHLPRSSSLDDSSGCLAGSLEIKADVCGAIEKDGASKGVSERNNDVIMEV